MKAFFILSLYNLAFAGISYSQITCSNVQVVSPVVPKPTQGVILSATCTVLQVQWKGASNQSYIASAAFYNAAIQKWETIAASGTSCDGSFNCKAYFPVKAGTKVSWSVQALQVINNRSFYSYSLVGARDYTIPAYTLVAANIEAKNDVQRVEETVISNGQLVVHPNPATSEITIQWSSEYRGMVTITIIDAIGKVVRLMNVNKERVEYRNRINISGFVTGLYYVGVQMRSGQLLNSKFIKE